MSVKQAAAFNRVSRTYLGREARQLTLVRIEGAGLLLPFASTWAVFASTHLAWHLAAENHWSYRFDLVLTHSPSAQQFVHSHVVTYPIVTFLLGAIGLRRWQSPHRIEGETHDASTALGVVIGVAAVPTHLQTLPLFGACIGAFAVANIASVCRRRSKTEQF